MSLQDTVKKARNLKSLTIILVVAFLALSAVVILIPTSLNIYFSLQAQQKAIGANQKLIAKDAADTVKGFIMDKFEKLQSGVKIGDISVASQEDQKIILEKLIGIEPAFRQLLLLDSQGNELVKVSRLSSFVISQLTEEIKSSMFLEVSQGNTYISLVYIDEITSEPMVVMAVPVTDIFGDFKGLLMAEVNLKFMWDLVAGIKVGEEGSAYVVDKDGNLIAFKDVSRVLKRENLEYLEEVNKFTSEGLGVHEPKGQRAKGIEGTDTVTTHEHLWNPDWAVIVEIPVTEAYENIITQLKLSITVLILSFVLAILVGIYLSKKIISPIKNLTNKVNQISKGEFEVQLEGSKINEIQDLTDSLGRILASMKLAIFRSGIKKEDLGIGTKEALEEKKKAEEQAEKRLKQLERFAKLSEGREMKMIELKKRINDLEKELEKREKIR